jgi:hypothetical protein
MKGSLMNKQILKRYIVETINLLKDLANRAKLEADNSKEGSNDYIKGVIMGYYSIITLLKHEAFVFCIDQKELGLAEIRPDVDLLGLVRNSALDFGEDNWAVDVMSEEKIKGYLSDSITLLKEQAREVKKEVHNPKEGYEDYNKGEWMAYSSLFSLLKRQASAFNIDEKEFGINIEL